MTEVALHTVLCRHLSWGCQDFSQAVQQSESQVSVACKGSCHSAALQSKATSFAKKNFAVDFETILDDQKRLTVENNV